MLRIKYLRYVALAIVAFVASAVAFFAPGQQAGFQMVAHSTLDHDSFTKTDLSDYFLKKKTKWDDGTEVKPVDLNQREVREAFCSEVHNRSLSAIKKYWQRQIFTGRGTPPPEKASTQEILEFVGTTPGAIGYVPAGTNLSGTLVKAISLR